MTTFAEPTMAPHAPPTTEELLGQLSQLPARHPHRATLRAQIIQENLPMAANLARRYAGRGELLEDLNQVAALALIKVVDSYDPSRQIPFAGYAIPSILGSLKRHFRDAAWAMRVPRSTQELARQVSTASGELSQYLSRTPTTIELAGHLHVSVGSLAAAVGARRNYSLASLNAQPAGNGSADLVGDLDPRYARVDDHLSLEPLVAALPQRERRILTMRFYDHMNQRQIAAEIGLSQMHVSRLLKQTLALMRSTMQQ